MIFSPLLALASGVYRSPLCVQALFRGERAEGETARRPPSRRLQHRSSQTAQRFARLSLSTVTNRRHWRLPPSILFIFIYIYTGNFVEIYLEVKCVTSQLFKTTWLRLSPDKAGGNKFSKDFEEGSMKLQEVVKFLEGQKEAGPALLEALGNADVFYEMQYKEVKIVANVSQILCCET